MNPRHLLYSIVIFLICVSFGAFSQKQSESTLKKSEWLIGTWENKRAKGSIYEQWKKSSTKEFVAWSYVLKQSDTVTLESIRLLTNNDGTFYIPNVKNQIGGKDVSFKATAFSEDEMIFENADHDFPQKISYKRISSDSLIAEISGTVNGQFRSQKFPMKKIL